MSHDSKGLGFEMPAFTEPTPKSPEEKMIEAIREIPDSERITYHSVRYGQIVQAYFPGSRHTALKVHFFNHRGVLVGNVYEFLPYERLRLHEKGIVWERVYYGKRFEKIRAWWYQTLCLITTYFIRITQSICK